MSTRVLARCGVTAETGLPANFDRVLDLRQDEPAKNVSIKITNVTAAIVRDLQPLSRDLLDIATYVYVADSSVSRGGSADVYGRKWHRSFLLRVPVRVRSVWAESAVGHALQDLLGYLTGDELTFEFYDHPGDEGQQYLEFKDYTPFPGADCVCLFSGGADSLAGAVALAKNGERPLLVSHRSTAVLDARQKNLREALCHEIPSWGFPHVSVWAHRVGTRPSDFTQRSRTFLYLTLASVTAHELELAKVVIPENGVVSVNLPKLEQSFSTRASRSTQPKFIAMYSDFIGRVLGKQTHFVNPLLFSTKADVLRSLADAGHPTLIQESVSCAHTMGRPAITPHCGLCSQCIERRFATVAAGLDEYDLAERYQIDIFLDPLHSDGLQQGESHVRAAYRYDTMTADEFASSYSQVLEALPHLQGTTEEAAHRLFELHQRAARETLSALEVMVTRNARRLARGDLPDSCLLALAGARHFRRDLSQSMAVRIGNILATDLPLRFRSTQPQSETELQDAVDAALHTAAERLRREGPVVPYSVVATTPDFSSNASEVPLFVEVKLVKDRNSLRYAIKSIGQASTYYADQGAYALFLVYDTDRLISDDEKFAEPFESKGRAMIKVCR